MSQWVVFVGNFIVNTLICAIVYIILASVFCRLIRRIIFKLKNSLLLVEIPYHKPLELDP